MVGRSRRDRSRRGGPRPRLRPLRRSDAQPLGAAGGRGVGAPALRRPAHHRARLVVRHDRRSAPAPSASTASGTARDHTYDRLAFATSRAVRVPRVWERLSAEGRPSVVVGVPGTYPPAPMEGALVGVLPHPVDQLGVHVAAGAEGRDRQVVGEYHLDVADFRSLPKEMVQDHVSEMTRTRFALARHLVTTRPWEFFMVVEIGGDRLQHAFWAYAHPTTATTGPTRCSARSSRTTTRRSTPSSAGCSKRSGPTSTSSSSPTTAPSTWTAGSPSTSGCGRTATWSCTKSRLGPRR